MPCKNFRNPTKEVSLRKPGNLSVGVGNVINAILSALSMLGYFVHYCDSTVILPSDIAGYIPVLGKGCYRELLEKKIIRVKMGKINIEHPEMTIVMGGQVIMVVKFSKEKSGKISYEIIARH